MGKGWTDSKKERVERRKVGREGGWKVGRGGREEGGRESVKWREREREGK